jgi:hypothetical protein
MLPGPTPSLGPRTEPCASLARAKAGYDATPNGPCPPEPHGPGVFVLWDLTLSMSVRAYRHRGGDPPVVACVVAAVRRPRR